jgi:hypothetical protein
MFIPRLTLTLLLVLPVGALFAQGYTINGKIKGVDDGWVFVRHRQTGKADSGRIIKGSFTVSGPMTVPEFCNFGFSANGVKDYYLGFFLERGNFTIKADKKALNDIGIVFRGSAVETAFQQFQRKVSYIQGHYYPESVNPRLEQLAANYALSHPQSYISAFALDSYEDDLHKLSRLYRRLASKVQQSYYGKLIHDKLQGPPHSVK